ncbi:hypothetical protein H2200_001595 [Cladophialophora chaetospira]|uniref:C2H2-type domain-containing protein n=1 Tax=Cladophialophora chaetospira TaxID=386627 RepID=A0AA39CPS6_9EURO|nr:hypothetical protein H2200_001595 [Cladophialophora chaetospira]
MGATTLQLLELCSDCHGCEFHFADSILNMHEGEGRSSAKTNTIRCSYCQRTFARTEHLARHERSHRNEKPFKCNYCESTFTRKDVIKRHHLRYHLDLLEPGTGGGHMPRQTSRSELDTLEPPERAIIPSSQYPPAPSSLQTTSSGYIRGQIDEILLPDVVPEALDPVNPMSALLPGMDVNFSWDTMLVEDNIWGSKPFEETNPDVNVAQLPSFSQAPERSRPDWKGSCEISPSKRRALEQDIRAAFAQTIEPANFKFPSCLTFERLLTNCLEHFILQVPCLHIPTWRADDLELYVDSVAGVDTSATPSHWYNTGGRPKTDGRSLAL